MIIVTFLLNYLWLCFVPYIWNQSMCYNKETLVLSGQTFNIHSSKLKLTVRQPKLSMAAFCATAAKVQQLVVCTNNEIMWINLPHFSLKGSMCYLCHRPELLRSPTRVTVTFFKYFWSSAEISSLFEQYCAFLQISNQMGRCRMTRDWPTLSSFCILMHNFPSHSHGVKRKIWVTSETCKLFFQTEAVYRVTLFTVLCQEKQKYDT